MIAIPNMELPKTCYECDSDFASSFGCEEWWVFEEGKEKRSPDCPLLDIVQCWECKYYEESEYIEGDMVCKYHMRHTYYTEADKFCSYGERRSDEHNRKTLL